MNNDQTDIEYVMRVALPKDGGGTTADAEMSEASRMAILANLPEGFEVRWASRKTWPVDGEGRTWVLCFCTDQERGMHYFIRRCELLRQSNEAMRNLATQIAAIQ